jgi:hypothetical protein
MKMLDLEERDEITIVRLAHGKVNALDVELLQAIARAFGSQATTSGPCPRADREPEAV